MVTLTIPAGEESERKRDALTGRVRPPQFRPFSKTPGRITPIEPNSFLLHTYLDIFNVKNLGALKSTIRLNEGVRHSIYRDKFGHFTIGVGFTLRRKDAGEKFRQIGANIVEIAQGKATLSPSQIDNLLDLSIIDALTDVRKIIPDFDSLSAGRQNALADMMFQLGQKRFSGFKRMINAVNNKNWPGAAKELLDSKLALTQTPDRARRNAEKMLGGPIQKIGEFSQPFDPETGEQVPADIPFITGLGGEFEGVDPIPSPKLQKKFDEQLLQRLDGLPLGDLGRIALNQELITEAGLTVISRKDLIKVIFHNLTLSAQAKGA